MNAGAMKEVATGHAPFSPSGFKRKALCPGSHSVERTYPNTSSEAAIDGTHTHKLVEVCLIHNKKNANEYLGTRLIDEEGEFEIKADRIERANVAITYVNNQVTASAYPVLVQAEGKLDPGSLIFRDDWYGTGDIGMVCVKDHEEGTVIDPANIQWINVADYKDGAQPVDPFENYQGISYMLGVIAIFNPPFATPIRFTIIQPKAGGIKEWDTTVGELMTEWLPKCEQVIVDSLDSNAIRVAGVEQCHYCLHKKKCIERQATAIHGINEAMGDIAVVTDIQVAPAIDFTSDTQALAPVVQNGIVIPNTLPVIGDMDDDTISSVMLIAPIIRGWLKDLDEEALHRVKEGGRIPLFKLVQKNGRRSWQPEVGDAAIMKALLAMTANKERIFKKADIVEEKLISFAKVLGNANLSANQKQRIEKEFIKKPQGQKALVLETEKGVDISPAALLENADMPVVEMHNSTDA